jgi:hypothetical protein
MRGADPVRDRILRLEFSDASSDDYDLAPLIARVTSLTAMLADDAYFGRFFHWTDRQGSRSAG